MKKILMTGGGTAGHVTPNIALFPLLKERGYDIHYVGSYDGIEKKLITEQGIRYSGISSGKLRRYFSLQNFTDPFRILKGFSEANKIIKEYKPDVLFSKGGFVSVPVVFAAAKHKIPVIIHESDISPGLANKLSIPKATYVCHNFPETANYLPKGKSVLSGCPIRGELLSGNRISGLNIAGFSANKPVLMIIGGSLGAKAINDIVRNSLDELLKDFQILHLCGKGKVDENFNGIEGYKQFEYVNEELRDLFAATDIVISRAGANAICELLALRKPNILIPLSAKASRGDQILNANSFKKQGFSVVLDEDDLTKEFLISTVHELYENKDLYINAMSQTSMTEATNTIVELIESLTKK